LREILEPGEKALIVLNESCIDCPILFPLFEAGMQLNRHLNILRNAHEVRELPYDPHFRIVQTRNCTVNAEVNGF